MDEYDFTTPIDLSLPVTTGMPIWSGKAPTVIAPLNREGRERGSVEQANTSLIVTESHAGTHVDAPFLYWSAKATLDRVPLDRFVGPATILDFSAKGAGDKIDVADLEVHGSSFGQGARVILRTGWDQHLERDERLYFDVAAMPSLTVNASRWVARRGLRLVGVDTPSVCPGGNREHAAVFDAEDPPAVLECLAGLEAVGSDRCFVIALPWRIIGGDACPVRAVAFPGR